MEGETPEQFLERMRSIRHISRRSGNRISEGCDSAGKFKATTDELNNTVVERNESQDVIVRAPMIKKVSETTEVR